MHVNGQFHDQQRFPYGKASEPVWTFWEFLFLLPRVLGGAAHSTVHTHTDWALKLKNVCSDNTKWTEIVKDFKPRKKMSFAAQPISLLRD